MYDILDSYRCLELPCFGFCLSIRAIWIGFPGKLILEFLRVVLLPLFQESHPTEFINLICFTCFIVFSYSSRISDLQTDIWRELAGPETSVIALCARQSQTGDSP